MKYIYSILTIIFVTACSVNNTNTIKKQYVVQAYLIANEYLPSIRLSTTVAPGVEYIQRQVAVSNGKMEIRLLNNDHSVRDIYPYRYDDNGIYVSELNIRVKAGQTYQLYITFPDNHSIISSVTTIPDSLRILKVLNDTVHYGQSKPVQIQSAVQANPSRKYIFNLKTQDPQRLTPYYQHQLDTDPNQTPEWYYLVESEIMNETNFKFVSDDVIELVLPWDTIAFYGPNLVYVNVIDTNLYDFLRSINTKNNNQFNAGYINEVIYHIKGGIGIFGSMYRDSTTIDVLP